MLKQRFIDAYNQHFGVDYDKRTDATLDNVRKSAFAYAVAYNIDLNLTLKQLYEITCA